MSKQVTTWAADAGVPNLDPGINKGEMQNPSKVAVDHSLARTFVNNRVAPNTAYAGNAAGHSATAVPAGGMSVSFEGAREGGRSIPAHQLSERSVVKFGPTETTIGNLARMGLVRIGQNGLWEAVGGGASQQQQQGASRDAQQQLAQQPTAQQQPQQQEEDATPPVSLPPATTQALNEAFDADPSAATSIANAVLAGRDPSAAIAQLASQSGKEPTQVQAQLSDTIAVFEGRAMDHVTQQLGGDTEMAEAAMAWAHDNRMDDLQRADAAFWKTGRPDYRGVVQDYIADLGRSDPGRVLAMAAEAGLTARKVSGEVVVDVPGAGQMGWRVAIKQGLIRFAK